MRILPRRNSAFTASTVFTDGFNRANQSLETSADWTKLATSDASFDIVSNQAVLTTTTDNRESDYAYGQSLGADQYAEFEFISNPDFTFISEVYIEIRQDGSRNNYYRAAYRQDNDQMLLQKRVAGGSRTTLASESTFNLSANDVVRLEANGTTVRILINGAELLSATDSDVTSGGVGIGGFLSRTSQAITIDNFECGEL